MTLEKLRKYLDQVVAVAGEVVKEALGVLLGVHLPQHDLVYGELVLGTGASSPGVSAMLMDAVDNRAHSRRPPSDRCPPLPSAAGKRVITSRRPAALRSRWPRA